MGAKSLPPVEPFGATTAAYLAGLIDGEGHVTLSRNVRPDGRPDYYSPQLVIGMTDLDTIMWLHEVVRGTWRWPHPKPGQKDVWGWQVTGMRAIEVIRQVHPYLRTKRRQADLLLEFGLRLNSHRLRLSDEEVRARQELWDRMRVYNLRGQEVRLWPGDSPEEMRTLLSAPSTTGKMVA